MLFYICIAFIKNSKLQYVPHFQNVLARKFTPLSFCTLQKEDSFYPPKMDNPPLVKSTERGTPQEFLFRRAPQLLHKRCTPFFHRTCMTLLIS